MSGFYFGNNKVDNIISITNTGIVARVKKIAATDSTANISAQEIFDKPASLQVSSTPSEINLQWNEPAYIDQQDPIIGYVIQYREFVEPPGYEASWSTINTSSTNTSFNLSELLSNTTYEVRVATRTNNGVSSYNEPKTISTQ